MPFALLQKHAAAKDSGEIIVAGDAGLEVHIYLLGGRIAWAASTLAPNALTTCLIEKCAIDKAALREVVEECRRSGTRFADTLIEWKVATAQQVRAALHTQISNAIATLVDAHTERSIFLPRQLDYSPELTFELSEIIQMPTSAKSATPAMSPVMSPFGATASRSPTRPSVSRPGAAAKPATPSKRSIPKIPPIPPIAKQPRATAKPVAARPVAARPAAAKPVAARPAAARPAAARPPADHTALVSRVEIALPAALWTRSLHGVGAIDDKALASLQRVANAIGGHGATACTLRSASGTILCHVIPGTADWIVCGFPANANVVRANDTLSRTIGGASSPVGLSAPSAPPVSEDSSLTDLLGPLRAQMRQTGEMIAGLVLRLQKPQYIGIAQSASELPEMAQLAASCVHNLPNSLAELFGKREEDRETLTVSIETAAYWHYGSVLSEGSELFLWMVLATQTPRGAGRVLLKRLVRQMGDDEPMSITGMWGTPTLDPPSEERPQTRPPTAREEPSRRDDFSRREDSSVFDEAHYEDEETSSVYQIAPARGRGKPPPRGGSSGAFG